MAEIARGKIENSRVSKNEIPVNFKNSKWKLSVAARIWEPQLTLFHPKTTMQKLDFSLWLLIGTERRRWRNGNGRLVILENCQREFLTSDSREQKVVDYSAIHLLVTVEIWPSPRKSAPCRLSKNWISFVQNGEKGIPRPSSKDSSCYQSFLSACLGQEMNEENGTQNFSFIFLFFVWMEGKWKTNHFLLYQWRRNEKANFLWYSIEQKSGKFVFFSPLVKFGNSSSLEDEFAFSFYL